MLGTGNIIYHDCMYDVKHSLAGQLPSIYNIYAVAGGGVVLWRHNAIVL